MKDKKHLIWMQIEGMGRNRNNYNEIGAIISKLDYKFIEFDDMICAAPTTVMSTIGLLTGVQPVLLAKRHFSKPMPVPEGEQAYGYETLTDFLTTQGYNVIGFNDVRVAKDIVPMFHDRHQGVTEELSNRYDYVNFWDTGVFYERFKNVKSTLKNNYNALLFHLIGSHNHKLIPSIIDHCAESGMTPENSVFLIVGDHGLEENWLDFLKMELKILEYKSARLPKTQHQNAIPHDLHLGENTLTVGCYLAFPGSKKFTKFGTVSALDLAPTVLNLMGYDDKKVLQMATGINLFDYLEEDKKVPDRNIRVDNRYIEQRKHKIIAFLNSKFRYIYRYDTDWEYSPFYKTKFEPVIEDEELYDRRKDKMDMENLIYNHKFWPVASDFRKNLVKSEVEIREKFYGNVKDYKIGFQEFRKKSDISSLRFKKFKLLYPCLRYLKQSMGEHFENKIAIYGAGEHTHKIVESQIIPKDKIMGIFEDVPKQNKICDIKVYSTNEVENVDFDDLLLSSIYEEKLLSKVKDWLPVQKKVLGLYNRNQDSWINEWVCQLATIVKETPMNSDFLSNVFEITRFKSSLIISTENFDSKEWIISKCSSGKHFLTHINRQEKMNEAFELEMIDLDKDIITCSIFQYLMNFNYQNILNGLMALHFSNKFDFISFDVNNNYFELISCLERVETLLNKGGFIFVLFNSKLDVANNIWKHFQKNKSHLCLISDLVDGFGIASLLD